MDAVETPAPVKREPADWEVEVSGVKRPRVNALEVDAAGGAKDGETIFKGVHDAHDNHITSLLRSILGSDMSLKESLTQEWVAFEEAGDDERPPPPRAAAYGRGARAKRTFADDQRLYNTAFPPPTEVPEAYRLATAVDVPPLESEETVHLTHDEQESILEAKRDRIPHPRAVDMVPYYENARVDCKDSFQDVPFSALRTSQRLCHEVRLPPREQVSGVRSQQAAKRNNDRTVTSSDRAEWFKHGPSVEVPGWTRVRSPSELHRICEKAQQEMRLVVLVSAHQPYYWERRFTHWAPMYPRLVFVSVHSGDLLCRPWEGSSVLDWYFKADLKNTCLYFASVAGAGPTADVRFFDGSDRTDTKVEEAIIARYRAVMGEGVLEHMNPRAVETKIQVYPAAAKAFLLAALEVPPAGRSGRLKMEVYPGGALDEEVELEVLGSDCAPARQPRNNRRQLWANQLRSLAWMVEQEQTTVTIMGENRHVSKAGVAPFQDLEVHWRLRLPFCVSGGVLADKIGSGKTGTVLGLVLEDKWQPEGQRMPDVSNLFDSLQAMKPVRGTLVIAPSHLVGQWRSEQEAVAPGLECLWVTQATQLQNPRAKTDDLSGYDIVGISQQLFESPTYQEYLGIPSAYRGTHCSRQYVDAVGRLRRGEERGRGKKLCVENFFWKRVVFDEFHELLSEEARWTLPMRSIYAKHRWGLTGTPPTTNLADLSDAAILLHLELGSAPEACKDFCQKCIRTNGLEANQAVLPPVEHVVDVVLSDPERALYEHRKAEVQRRTTDQQAMLEECILACNTWEGDTPANALDKLKSHLADQVRQQEEKQKMWESLLKSQLLKLNQPGLSVGQREKLRGEKDEIEDNVRNIERDYDAARDAQQRLSTILNGLENGDRDAQQRLSTMLNGFENGALRYGAKVASVLEKIREIMALGEKKILVYVQFDPLQKTFVTALAEAGISHLVLKGGPAEITGILKKFTEEKTHNVLVLSLARKAAGINLTCSSQVLFLHPFLNADQNRAKAWEAQAIGRAARAGQSRQVHVWRFLCRGTVEDELRAHFTSSSWKTYFSKFNAQLADRAVPIKAEPMSQSQLATQF
jgi:hypothetical protein